MAQYILQSKRVINTSTHEKKFFLGNEIQKKLYPRKYVMNKYNKYNLT